jgi:hypothetical protein
LKILFASLPTAPIKGDGVTYVHNSQWHSYATRKNGIRDMKCVLGTTTQRELCSDRILLLLEGIQRTLMS